MKIFADQKIGELLATLFSQIGDQNFYVVQLEQKLTPYDNLQDVAGLSIVLEIAKEGLPVVMLGWQTAEMYIDRKGQEWHAAMAYPNVMLRRLPALPEDLMSAIEEVAVGSRQPDPLAIALLTAKQTQDTIGVLNHDLSSARRDTDRMVQWEEKARGVFGDQPQAELISLVESAKSTREIKSQFAGQKFPDVCVDVEGTLLTSDGQLRPEVLALVKEKANGGPITIWTGGDVHALSKQLHKAGVFYKITSKSTMKGATVRVVIDDQPEATFKSDYGIGHEEYIQV